MEMKICAMLMVLVLALVCMTGCSSSNYDIVDTVRYYDEAIVSLADGTVVHGKVDNWCDYEDSDQIQVKIEGVTYLVHSTDVTLISY